MTKEQVQVIVGKFTSLGLEDSIVVYTDNEYMVHMKSDTSVGYFDNSNELFWGFRTNNSPIRGLRKDEKFLLEAFDYEHIVTISVDISNSKISNAQVAVAFDSDNVTAVIQNVIGEHQATNYTTKVDKDGNNIYEHPSNMGGVRLE